MTLAAAIEPVLASFQGAFEFIFTPQESSVTGGEKVGGPDQVVELALNQLEATGLALALASLVALPVGFYFGHRGSGEALAIAIGNAGRAIPELVLIAFMAAAIGIGLLPVTVALAVIGVPPLLTNAFVGIRQVDRASVDAARGMGMTEVEVLRKVELPLSVPTLMTGVRTASINIVATATLAPLAGYLTLGDFILGRNVYGDDGVLAGAILVALLALALESALAGVQRVLTPSGMKPSRA